MRDDVAIVGAGPAGARAAYVLARAARGSRSSTASHPREKPCGGGVTGRALALVADAIDAAQLAAAVIRSARFTDTPRGRSAVVALKDHDNGADRRVDGARRRRAGRRRAARRSTRAAGRGRARRRAARSVARHRRDRRRSRRVARHDWRRAATRVVRHRRRRRQQPGAAPRRRAVPPRSAVDRDRVLRARRHQRRDRRSS